jgi:hypothetical protein
MLINKLLDCLDGDWVKVGIFGKTEMAFYLGEKEYPISVFLHRDGTHEVCFDIEGYAYKFTTDQILSIGVVMSLLSEEESIKEMRAWVEDLE